MSFVDSVKENSDLSECIVYKYCLKNIIGYGLNVLLDFLDLIEIIKYLIIGFEGILVFIVDIIYYIVIEYVYKYIGFFIFDDISKVCDLV